MPKQAEQKRIARIIISRSKPSCDVTTTRELRALARRAGRGVSINASLQNGQGWIEFVGTQPDRVAQAFVLSNLPKFDMNFVRQILPL